MKILKLLFCLFSIKAAFAFQNKNIRFSEDKLHKYEVNVLMEKNEEELKRKNVPYYSYKEGEILATNYGVGDGRVLHGRYKKISKTSNSVVEEGEFINGIKNGEWIIRDVNGGLSSITFWEEGKKNGKYEYYVNDRLIIKGKYKKGKKSGKWNSYAADKVIEETWKQGMLHGVYKEYGANGKLLLKGVYKDNKKDGKWVFYDPKKEEHFEEGVRKKEEKQKKKKAKKGEKVKEKKDTKKSEKSEKKKESFWKKLFGKKKD